MGDSEPSYASMRNDGNKILGESDIDGDNGSISSGNKSCVGSRVFLGAPGHGRGTVYVYLGDDSTETGSIIARVLLVISYL